MKKDNSFNHFDFVPATVGRKRSTFKFSKRVTTGAYLGFLYPMCNPIELLPGSSIDIKNLVAEVMTGALIKPLFEELYLDVFAFAVPNRIVWEHWKQYLGSTDEVLFDSLTTYQKPYIMYKLEANATASGKEGFRVQQSLAANFELPKIASSGTAKKISALPFRGYNFIWNQYFRPEQLANPILFSKGDRGNAGDNVGAVYTGFNITLNSNTVYIPEPGQVSGSNPATACSGGVVLPVYRAHRSLQTACLPNPSLETLSLLSSVEGFPSVTLTNDSEGQGLETKNIGAFTTTNGAINTLSGAIDGEYASADWSKVVLTVNNYRETIMLQNYYDALNRAGSRYQEIMYNIFGTRPKDAIIDIPELIIHKRFTIFRNKVVSTTETLNSSNATVNNVGSQSANIDTVVKDSFFRYTAFEHTLVHIDYCIRAASITMADGIEPSWKVLDKLEEYYPQYDGMGDIPHYKDEIYAAANDDVVFGYNEYGARYKYQRNSAIGWVNPNVANYVAGYTLAEEVAAAPSLKSDLFSYVCCINEFAAFAKCLAIVSPEVAPQFVIHWRLQGTITHPMPTYNIPGQGALL